MSDSHEAGTQAGQQPEPVPGPKDHSGNVHESMREDHPTGEISQPIDEEVRRLLSTPDDPATLPENVQQMFDAPAVLPPPANQFDSHEGASVFEPVPVMPLEKVAEEESSHTMPLPPVPAQETDHTKPNKLSRLVVGLGLAAGAVAVAAVALLIGGKDDDKVASTPTTQAGTPSTETPTTQTPTTSETPTTVTTVENGGVVEPQLAGLEIPVAEDPNALADQLFKNLESASNTNDLRYLALHILDLDSELGVQTQEKMQKIVDHKAQGFTDYRQTIDVSVVGEPTKNQETNEMSMTVDFINTEIFDKFDNTKTNHYVYDLRLVKADREITDINGQAQTVSVWLIAEITKVTVVSEG